MLITHLDCLNLAHWLHTTASEDGLGPICFALVDAQGDLVWFERMDNAPARASKIAIAKAYTALRMGKTTKEFHQQLSTEQLCSHDFMDHRLSAIPGGAPLLNTISETIVGAVGISGRHTESDQHLADKLATYFCSY